ncbi:MAG: hypothetical protein FJ294_05155 [Planctomycetes bacterium]|nr:hypothetical protein [Planctomycetota bacterium]
MLILSALLALAPTTTSASGHPSAIVQQAPSVRERFVALHAEADAEGCKTLWKKNPQEILYAIDEDLEAALATWEKSPQKPDGATIASLHARALWGARLASEELAAPIFLDYASAFASQDDDQKKQFRAGQKAHGEARAAIKAGDWEKAIAKARECIGHAAPLGDWWGHAMGLSALGTACSGGGKLADAIAPLGEAALIYRNLRLPGDEYVALRRLATVLVETGAKPRAKSVLERALELGSMLGDDKGVAELQALAKSL